MVPFFLISSFIGFNHSRGGFRPLKYFSNCVRSFWGVCYLWCRISAGTEWVHYLDQQWEGGMDHVPKRVRQAIPTQWPGYTKCADLSIAGPNTNVNISQRLIPAEPLYIIMNLGISYSFGKVRSQCQPGPKHPNEPNWLLDL
jgi:hypothetical protein